MGWGGKVLEAEPMRVGGWEKRDKLNRVGGENLIGKQYPRPFCPQGLDGGKEPEYNSANFIIGGEP